MVEYPSMIRSCHLCSRYILVILSGTLASGLDASRRSTRHVCSGIAWGKKRGSIGGGCLTKKILKTSKAHKANIHTQTTLHYTTSTNTYIVFPTRDPWVTHIYTYLEHSFASTKIRIYIWLRGY